MSIRQIKVEIVYTDTTAGDPNYNWAKRWELIVPEVITTATLMRIAKELAGIQGAKGRWGSYGDNCAFKPSGLNTVLFINF